MSTSIWFQNIFENYLRDYQREVVRKILLSPGVHYWEGARQIGKTDTIGGVVGLCQALGFQGTIGGVPVQLHPADVHVGSKDAEKSKEYVRRVLKKAQIANADRVHYGYLSQIVFCEKRRYARRNGPRYRG